MVESFTHFVTFGSWRALFRELVRATVVFTLTAAFWAVSVVLALALWGHQPAIGALFLVLCFAHIPLLAFPLTIFPTIGYRLEQVLRLTVYIFFVAGLTVYLKTPLTIAAVVCLPGWLLHFFLTEWRLLNR